MVQQHITRRKVVAGTAWAAPAVLLSATTPAFAASADSQACLSHNAQAYTRTYSTVSAPSRRIKTRDVTVPAGASYMRFTLSGGGGGSVYAGNGDPTGGRGGMGAKITGILKVSPGQVVKFQIGAGGIGYYNQGSSGGEGYGVGGSTLIDPETVYSAADKATMDNSSYLHVINYGGSGGGSSAISIVEDPKNNLGKETLIALAGGGGGGSARGMAFTVPSDAPDDNFSNAHYAMWNFGTGSDPETEQPAFPQISRAGSSGPTPTSATDGKESYQFYPSATLSVHGGGSGSGGTGGTGGQEGSFTTADGLSFTTTTNSLITQSIKGGVAGGNGYKAAGGNGVAAYSYAIAKNNDLPRSNMTSYMVSAGGGAGYGGGGSGSVTSLGAQVTDTPYKMAESKYAVSSGAVGAAGGAGGSFVNSTVIDATIEPVAAHAQVLRGNYANGEGTYAFCSG